MCNNQSDDNVVLSVRDLAIGYVNKIINSDINFDIRQGEMVALIGRNGYGKSTLIKTLISFIKPLGGHVHYNTKLPLSRSVAVIFTHYSSFPNTSIHDIIAMGRIPYLSLFSPLRDVDEDKINAAFLQVKLDPSISLFDSFDSLSDGQKQKVLIAKALAQDTPIIILDEPTAFLDMVARIEIIKLLRQLGDEGRSILISSHDISLMQRYADSFLLFNPPVVIMRPIEHLNDSDVSYAIYGKEI